MSSLRQGSRCIDVPSPYLPGAPTVPVDDAGVIHLADGGAIRTDPSCPDIEWRWGTYMMTGCCRDDGQCGLSTHTFPLASSPGFPLTCDSYASYQQLGYPVPPGSPTCTP